MTYIFNIILCVSIMYSFLSLSILLKLLKHVTLIVFENYIECKTKHLFLIKKSSKTIWWKNSDMAEKEHWWREESITADPKEEDPVSDDSKKTLLLRTLKSILSMRKLKRNLITVKPKDNAINEDPQDLQDPQWFLRRKLTLLAFW